VRLRRYQGLGWKYVPVVRLAEHVSEPICSRAAKPLLGVFGVQAVAARRGGNYQIRQPLIEPAASRTLPIGGVVDAEQKLQVEIKYARPHPPEEDHLRRDARRWRSRAPDLLRGLNILLAAHPN
jgi:hypothetical protein